MAKMKMSIVKKGMRIQGLLVLITILLFVLPAFSFQEEICGVVSGQVIDKNTGEGIESAWVHIKASLPGSHQSITDKQGEFVFNGVRPGTIYITINPPFPYAIPSIEKKDEAFRLERGKNLHIIKRVEIGGTIAGRVYDVATGLPFDKKDIYYLEVFGYSNFPSLIEKNGNYSISCLKPGEYDNLFVSVKGFASKVKNDIEVRSGEVTRVDFLFDSSKKGKISGKVVCLHDGSPLLNVAVWFSNGGFYYSKTPTNEDGVFVLHDVEPGEYKLSVTGEKEIDDDIEYINYETKVYEKNVLVLTGSAPYVEIKVDCSFDYSKIGWEVR